jgi:hypothetical protein
LLLHISILLTVTWPCIYFTFATVTESNSLPSINDYAYVYSQLLTQSHYTLPWKFIQKIGFSCINPFQSYVGPRLTLRVFCSQRFSWSLTLSNPIFLPPAYSPALIYFGWERGWWITCNYPTVLKEKNINRNRKSTTCTICWLKSVLYEGKHQDQENHNVRWSPTLWFSCSRCFSSCIMDFSQQVAQVVLFLFLFLSFKTVG